MPAPRLLNDGDGGYRCSSIVDPSQAYKNTPHKHRSYSVGGMRGVAAADCYDSRILSTAAATTASMPSWEMTDWPHGTRLLELVDTLEKCARRYRCFCLKYHSQKKRRLDARTGVRRILPETPGRLRSQRYERAGQLTFRPKWRYRRSKNCPRLFEY